MKRWWFQAADVRDPGWISGLRIRSSDVLPLKNPSWTHSGRTPGSHQASDCGPDPVFSRSLVLIPVDSSQKLNVLLLDHRKTPVCTAGRIWSPDGPETLTGGAEKVLCVWLSSDGGTCGSVLEVWPGEPSHLPLSGQWPDHDQLFGRPIWCRQR